MINKEWSKLAVDYILEKNSEHLIKVYKYLISKEKDVSNQIIYYYEFVRILYFFINRFNSNKNLFKLGFDPQKDLEDRMITEIDFLNNYEYYMDLVNEGFIYTIKTNKNKNVVIMSYTLYELLNER